MLLDHKDRSTPDFVDEASGVLLGAFVGFSPAPHVIAQPKELRSQVVDIAVFHDEFLVEQRREMCVNGTWGRVERSSEVRDAGSVEAFELFDDLERHRGGLEHFPVSVRSHGLRSDCEYLAFTPDE